MILSVLLGGTFAAVSAIRKLESNKATEITNEQLLIAIEDCK